MLVDSGFEQISESEYKISGTNITDILNRIHRSELKTGGIVDSYSIIVHYGLPFLKGHYWITFDSSDPRISNPSLPISPDFATTADDPWVIAKVEKF